jgi:hypothetical protein
MVHYLQPRLTAHLILQNGKLFEVELEVSDLK